MILDTNALSACADGSPAIREQIAAALGPFLPVIVLGEFRFGAMGTRDRVRRLAWLQALTEHWKVLEITVETATAYAEIRHVLKQQATPIPSNDAWIAALARQHSLPILSNDTHFDAVPGVRRVGW